MTDVKIVADSITKAELLRMARERFGDMVKVVVDVERGIMAVCGEFHADEEVVLMEQGSKREHTWGINLYPERPDDSWVEFDSMINLKPALGNRSRSVEDEATREKVRAIVKKLVIS